MTALHVDQIQAIRFVSTSGDEDFDAIDQVLLLVADHHARLGAELDQRRTISSLVALRQSPLGRKLRRLADATRDNQDIDISSVRREADEVVALLMQPLAADDVQVPQWFWGTSIGQMLASAIHRTYPSDHLFCLGAVAERLDEDRATVERWVADGTLTGIHDENGSIFVPVKQVELFRSVARAFDGPVHPPVDSLVTTRAA